VNAPAHTPERTAAPAADHLVVLADQIADGLLDRTLPKARWTHEGHLLACIALVRRHGAADALRFLRGAIPLYNEATGVANTLDSGYHDTITVYFVWAIDRLLTAGVTTPAIVSDPSVERTALLGWWDRDTLMSRAARAAWLAPTGGDNAGPIPTEWLRPELSAI